MDRETAVKQIQELSVDNEELSDYLMWSLDEVKKSRNINSYSKMIRLEGKRFGKLKVLEEINPQSYKPGNKKRTWLCKCSCGNYKIVTQDILKPDRNCSCGCETQVENLLGKRFGKLVVVERLENVRDSSGHMRSYYVCECDCGNKVQYDRHSLTKGSVNSCGCYKKELMQNPTTNWRFQKFLRENKETLRRTLYHIQQRCLNENYQNYRYYGFRGISVCDEWCGEDGYMNFYLWAYKNGFRKGLSIDRINNDGDYTPDNCRWTTHKEQQRNKSTTHYIEYKGETKSIGEFAELYNIPYNVLWNRISNGWSVENAIETPTKRA